MGTSDEAMNSDRIFCRVSKVRRYILPLTNFNGDKNHDIDREMDWLFLFFQFY